MEPEEVKNKLGDYSKVFADTPIFLYFFEENPDWIDSVIPAFELAEQKEIKLVTSTITTLEVITGFAQEDDQESIESFKDMLKEFGVEVLNFKREHVEVAAQLRAEHGFKTPDTIQLALTVEEDIPAFLTNDQQLTAVDKTEVFYLGN